MEVGEAVAYSRQIRQDLELMPPQVGERYLAMAEQTHDFQEASRIKSTLEVTAQLLGKLISTKAQTEMSSEPDKSRSSVPLKSASEQEALTETSVDSKENKLISDWAKQVIDDYLQPVSEPKLSKRHAAEKRKAKHFRRALQQVAFEEGDEPFHLAQKPVTAVAAAAILGQQLNQYTERGRLPRVASNQLADIFFDELRHYMNEQWREVTPDMLCQLIRLKSAGDAYRGEVAHRMPDEMLQAYFEGPRNPEQAVDAYYKFALAAVELHKPPDRDALAGAAKILNFETAILPLGSQPQERFASAWYLAAVQQGELAQKFLHSTQIAVNLYWVSFNSASTKNSEAGKRLFEPKPMLARDQLTKRLVDQVGASSYHQAVQSLSVYLRDRDKIHKLMMEHLASGGLPEDIKLDADIDTKWVDLVHRGNNQLARRYQEIFGSIEGVYNSAYKDRGRSIGYECETIAHIPVNDKYMLRALLPKQSATEILNVHFDAARQAWQKFQTSGADKALDNITRHELLDMCPAMNQRTTVLVDNKPVDILIKLTSRAPYDDIFTSPLAEFILEGFPYKPELNRAAVWQEALDDVEAMKSKAHRIVNKRGIRFVVDQPALVEQDLQSVDFFRVSANKTRMVLHLPNRQRETILQDYFFEGYDINAVDPSDKTIDDSFIRGYAYCVSLLRSWLTRPSVKTSEGIVEEGKEGPMKGGYFPYLRIRQSDGYKYRRQDEQWYICLEETGKDLDEISKNMQAQDPTGKGRNKTYVKLHPDDGIQKPPLRIYL